MSVCYVTAKDCTTHRLSGVLESSIWNGVERRIGKVERRSYGHDRRWENCRGRRRFMGPHDRRRHHG